MDMNEIKDLTFYMGDKSKAELWDIIMESCRVSTSVWRAYEELRLRDFRASRDLEYYKSRANQEKVTPC